MHKAIFGVLPLIVIGIAAGQEKPPSAGRLYFDRAHGELPPPGPLAGLATKLNLELVNVQEPVSAATLRGSRLLYLRAPSKTFVPAEQEAIIDFIKAGGSLLLVLDEEKRQSLATTRINDFLAPFGMRLTPDTPYVPNPGAIAKAGEINRSDRELPYDGGRSVEGGTPFAFQLDREGKPAQTYAASKRVEGGGRIIVLAEGMASLFLGSATGQRLAPVNDSAGTNGYWGKDSSIFMEEVLSWLAHQPAQ